MWKQWWPYKAGALVFILLMGGSNLLPGLDEVAGELGSPEGVRAAMFAVIAAAALFITRMPKDRARQDAAVDSVGQAISIAAAFAAGVYWLLDETKGNPTPYITTLLGVTGFLASVLAVTTLIQWWRDRSNQKED